MGTPVITDAPYLFSQAQRIIDLCGPQAAAYAAARSEQHQLAGDYIESLYWEVIRRAIDALDQLPPPGEWH
jgi:hypothetical protein